MFSVQIHANYSLQVGNNVACFETYLVNFSSKLFKKLVLVNIIQLFITLTQEYTFVDYRLDAFIEKLVELGKC